MVDVILETKDRGDRGGGRSFFSLSVCVCVFVCVCVCVCVRECVYVCICVVYVCVSSWLAVWNSKVLYIHVVYTRMMVW